MDSRPHLTENSKKLLNQRYLLKNEKGEIVETPRELFERVAKCVSHSEKFYSMEGHKYWHDRILDSLLNLDLMPASPYLFNARDPEEDGPVGGLFSCFVISVEDDIQSIYNGIAESAVIFKKGGGAGINFSCLREKNAVVGHNKSLRSSGPLSFMEVYSASSQVVTQAGLRRGASIAFLNDTHPDIEEFITIKSKNLPEVNRLMRVILSSSDETLKKFAQMELDKLQKLTSFNLSVAISDKFMQAVEDNADWDLITPQTGKVVKTTKARRLYNLICEYAWKSGDPGIGFMDTVNRGEKLQHLGPIDCSNPCFSINTRILTDLGYLTIGEYLTKHKDLEHLNILSHDGTVQKATQFFETGIKQLYKVTLKGGYSVEVTDNHEFLMTNGDVKQLNELDIGDEIPLQSHTLWPTNYDINIDEYVSIGNKPCEDTSMPTEWSRELGFVLGWLIGDGCLSKKGPMFIFGPDDDEALDFVKKHMDKWSNFDCPITYNKTNTRSLHYQRKVVFEYFRALGVTRNKSRDKCVPGSLFGAPKEAVAGFLNGLFSADATVIPYENQKCRCQIQLSTSSVRVMKDVQILLSNFGIRSSCYCDSRDREECFKYVTVSGEIRYYSSGETYSLRISPTQGGRIFNNEIGLLLPYKQRLLSDVSKIVSKKKIKQSAKIISIIPTTLEQTYCTKEDIKETVHSNGIITRRCGELYMRAYHACNLIALNLNRCMRNGMIDLEVVKKLAETATRIGENAIDVSDYPLKKIEENVKKTRGVGIGLMGFADILIQMGISYDTQQARDLLSQICEASREGSRRQSIQLAKERGVPENWKGSDWEKEGIKIRNLWHTTLQPTGSVAIVAGASHSIEPLFNVFYKRRTHDDKIFIELNESFREQIEAAGLNIEEIIERIEETGSIQTIDEIPQNIKDVFKCAHDVSPEGHIMMQAAAQKYIDSGVSKTINCPSNITAKDVAKMYKMAHELGCKGLTIFRDGCKTGVLSTKVNEDQDHEELRDFLFNKRCREGLKAKEIADILDVSESQVFAKLKRYGIKKAEEDTALQARKQKLSVPLKEVILANLLVGHSKINTVDNQSSYRQVTDHLVYAQSVRKQFIDNGINCAEIMSIVTDRTYYYFDTVFNKDIYNLPADNDYLLKIGKKELETLLTHTFVRNLFLVGGTQTGKGGIKFKVKEVNYANFDNFMKLLEKKIGVTFNRNKNNEVVYVSKQATVAFYNYIESKGDIKEIKSTEDKTRCPDCGSTLNFTEGCKTCMSCGWSACSM